MMRRPTVRVCSDDVPDRETFDRERAATALLELATFTGNPDVVYQVSENVAAESNAFDASHAALPGHDRNVRVVGEFRQ